MASSLDRGLAILERLSKAGGPVSFSGINESLGGINRATLSRLLKSLVESGYVSKDAKSGLYSCGYRLVAFFPQRIPERKEFLLEKYSFLLERIADKHGVTALLFEEIGGILVCLAKETRLGYIQMQEVGFANNQPEHLWMKLAAAWNETTRKAYTKKRDLGEIDRIKESGFAFDDYGRMPFRRLVVPLFSEAGEFIGAIGAGGTAESLPDLKVKRIVREVESVTGGAR